MLVSLPPNFQSTEECLSTMFVLLKCVNCSEVPKDNIWTPGHCNHKYCKLCIKKLARNECHICKIKSIQKDRTLDAFSTNLLNELRKFVKQVQAEYNLSNSESEPEPEQELELEPETEPEPEPEPKSKAEIMRKVSLESNSNSIAVPGNQGNDSSILTHSDIDPEEELPDIDIDFEEQYMLPKRPVAPVVPATNGKKAAAVSVPKTPEKPPKSKGKKVVKTPKTEKLSKTKTRAKLASTPEILANIFSDGEESAGEDDQVEVEVKNKSGRNKKIKDNEEEDSDFELDKDLPVLTPHPLTPTRAMAARAAKTLAAGSSKSEDESVEMEASPMKDKPLLKPSIRLERLESPSLDDFKKPGSRKNAMSGTGSSTNTARKTNIRTRTKGKKLDMDTDQAQGSKNPNFELSDSDDDLPPDSVNKKKKSDSASKFKTPTNKKTLRAKASSVSSNQNSKLESQSPFGIQPKDSAGTDPSNNLLAKKKYFKGSLATLNAKQGQVKSGSRITKNQRLRLDSTNFKNAKGKKNVTSTKEYGSSDDAHKNTAATTPAEESVFDFHATQSQVISPVKPLKKTTSHLDSDTDDKLSSTRTKRRRRISGSSVGSSSVASLEDLNASSSVSAKSKNLKPKRTRTNTVSSINSNSSFQSNKSMSKNSPTGASTVNKRNARGETALHIAARNGQLEKIKQLIEAGADVDAKDHAGWTPLHEAIFAKVTNFPIIKLLCTTGSGCDVNALGQNNETPLHGASKLGLSVVVSYLLSQSASPAIRNSDGKLPRDVTKSEAVLKIFDDYEKTKGQSQMNNDLSVELKISLQKAVVFFDYKPTPELLKQCRNILNLNISNELTRQVTHVILDTKPKSKTELNGEYLLAILNGCWMLSSQWLEDSVDVERFLDPRKYEIGGCHYHSSIPSSTVQSAIQRARVNREHGNPGLFDGMNFYLYKNTCWSSKDSVSDKDKDQATTTTTTASSPSSCTLSKKDIGKLIAFGSGKVINREPDPEMVDPLEYPMRFHAKEENANSSNHKLVLTSHVILYDDKNVPHNKYDMEHVKTLRIDWLIHSALHFQLLHPNSYLDLQE